MISQINISRSFEWASARVRSARLHEQIDIERFIWNTIWFHKITDILNIIAIPQTQFYYYVALKFAVLRKNIHCRSKWRPKLWTLFGRGIVDEYYYLLKQLSWKSVSLKHGKTYFEWKLIVVALAWIRVNTLLCSWFGAVIAQTLVS